MENKKRGKKGKYEEWLTKEKLELITGWCRNGLSDEQIAHNMGIHVTTLYTWKSKYKEFDEAMKIGKEVADLMVENALFKRACGFTLEDKKEVYSVKDGLKTDALISGERRWSLIRTYQAIRMYASLCQWQNFWMSQKLQRGM